MNRVPPSQECNARRDERIRLGEDRGVVYQDHQNEILSLERKRAVDAMNEVRRQKEEGQEELERRRKLWAEERESHIAAVRERIPAFGASHNS